MKKDMLLEGRVKIGCCCSKNDQTICYKNTSFYCYTWYYDSKRFYYCCGFSRISLETRTCFFENQHSMSQRFSWLLYLSPLHPLRYLLNFFCAYFTSVPLITPYNIPYVCCYWLSYCMNACDYSPVRQLVCIGHLHAYEKQWKKGMIWCKKTSFLTKSVDSFNK